MSATSAHDFAAAIARICGWLYTLAWSLSFYPQPILNFRRQTTSGLLPDFPLLNIFGFACFTTSTAAFLFSPVIRSQYAARHPRSPEPTVRTNDLAFGAHACVICVITYSQFWPGLWGWEKAERGVMRSGNAVSKGLIVGSLLAVTTLTFIAVGSGDGNNPTGWAWIDVIYSFSYIKLILTIFKFLPQAVSNHRRRSTRGWAIGQILLDFSGGILSLLQLVIDSALQGDWRDGLRGNPLKLGLANVSLVFDVIFLVQHYVLFGPVEERENQLDMETDPLLPEQSNQQQQR